MTAVDAKHADGLPTGRLALAHGAAAGELDDAVADRGDPVQGDAKARIRQAAADREVRQHRVDTAMLTGDPAAPGHVPDDILAEQLAQCLQPAAGVRSGLFGVKAPDYRIGSGSEDGAADPSSTVCSGS